MTAAGHAVFFDAQVVDGGSAHYTAMLWNFHPYGARLRREDSKRCSPLADPGL